MARYRWSADKGEAVPVETDEERVEREAREKRERDELEWEKLNQEREARRVGAYL